jgi:hypothetical protein
MIGSILRTVTCCRSPVPRCKLSRFESSIGYGRGSIKPRNPKQLQSSVCWGHLSSPFGTEFPAFHGQLKRLTRLCDHRRSGIFRPYPDTTWGETPGLETHQTMDSSVKLLFS